jgi:hypothetical protein
METIKTPDAFKNGLKDLDAKIRKANADFNTYLVGGAAALGVPSDWTLNPKTLEFEPPTPTKEEIKA